MATDSGGGPAVAGPGVNSAVLDAFEPFIEALADRIAARMQAGRERMVSQHESELGPRRHRDAVKRRLANGEGGAGRAGRNYLLTPEAVREELAGAAARKPPQAAAGAEGSEGRAGGKSRARDLGDFERDIMAGLRSVAPGGST